MLLTMHFAAPDPFRGPERAENRCPAVLRGGARFEKAADAIRCRPLGWKLQLMRRVSRFCRIHVRLSSPPLTIELRRCSDEVGLVPLTEGAHCAPDAQLAWANAADVVLVPGMGDSNLMPEAKYLEVIKEAHRRGAVVASLCSGAFVLAETGLLDGEAATTWCPYVLRQGFGRIFFQVSGFLNLGWGQGAVAGGG